MTGNLHARPARYPVAMDVLVLIDKLDDLVHNAKQVPLTDQVRVDKEEIYDLLDQMRATIPEEIKQARWIVKERQEMLAEAKREAERIVKEARERQERLISNEEVMKAAERAAEDIIEEAQAREREIRLGAEDYADEILNTLEINLSKFIAAVQRGRERLQGRDESAVVAAATPRVHRRGSRAPGLLGYGRELGRLRTSLRTAAILARAGVVRLERPDKLVRVGADDAALGADARGRLRDLGAAHARSRPAIHDERGTITFARARRRDQRARARPARARRRRGRRDRDPLPRPPRLHRGPRSRRRSSARRCCC